MENLEKVFYWFTAIITAVGGTSAVVLGLSNWLGNHIANRLLEKHKAKYQKEIEDFKNEKQQELEALKNKYQTELELRKAALEKSKALFFRYSEHQFTLYNELWKNLCDLRHIAEELWQKVEPQKLKTFSEQLGKTKLSVEKSALLIEDKHYKELIEILHEFGEFNTGKTKIIQLRNQPIEQVEMEVNTSKIINIINNNRAKKDNFTSLLVKLSKSFKQQIKG